MTEPSEENLNKAKNMAVNGKVRDPTWNMYFNVYEYANILDARDKAEIAIRIKDVEDKIESYERKEAVEKANELLNDPRVRKFFKVD